MSSLRASFLNSSQCGRYTTEYGQDATSRHPSSRLSWYWNVFGPSNESCSLFRSCADVGRDQLLVGGVIELVSHCFFQCPTCWQCRQSCHGTHAQKKDAIRASKDAGSRRRVECTKHTACAGRHTQSRTRTRTPKPAG